MPIITFHTSIFVPRFSECGVQSGQYANTSYFNDRSFDAESESLAVDSYNPYSLLGASR
jgi:hypothetical protein